MLSTENAPRTFSEKMEQLFPYFVMAAFILIVQAGSLWLSMTEYIASQPPLDNPESVGYAVYYIVVLVLFSALIIFLMRKKMEFIIRGIIYFSIAVTLYYVFASLLDKAIGLTATTTILAVAISVMFAILLYKYPEWYVIDIAGLAIAIGACAVIGVSLSYVPIIVMMIGLLIYDFISVYKTKHMLTLANGMMDMKLPILFVIPRKWSYSYIADDFSDGDVEKTSANDGSDASGTSGVNAESNEGMTEAEIAIQEKKKKSGALFMGLGDAVIPTLLVVSANRFIEHDGFISTPALFTIFGTMVGFAGLMYVVSKGKPQAGLPFLNTGAILGFIAGVLISGTIISFDLGF